MRVVVVGLGVMGLSAAAELAARGHDVIGIDRGDVGYRLASSSGASRIYRLAHPDRAWVRLGIWNHQLWDELEREAGRPLRWPRGLVWRGGLSNEVAAALAAEGVSHEELDERRQAEVFPELRWRADAPAVWQPDAGAVMADQALAAMADRLQRRGGRIVGGAVVEEVDLGAGGGSSVRVVAARGGDEVVARETYSADRVVITAGPWAGPLLRSVGVHVQLRSFLEQVTYVRGGDTVPWQQRPCVVDVPADASSFGFYAMPTPDIGYKIGIDQPVRPFHSDDADRTPVTAREREAVERIRRELPAFDATPIRSEVGAWTESDDDAFILDRVGDVVFGCGDSGQGFKWLPMFGQVLADLVEGRPHPASVAGDLELFGMARLGVAGEV